MWDKPWKRDVYTAKFESQHWIPLFTHQVRLECPFCVRPTSGWWKHKDKQKIGGLTSLIVFVFYEADAFFKMVSGENNRTMDHKWLIIEVIIHPSDNKLRDCWFQVWLFQQPHDNQASAGWLPSTSLGSVLNITEWLLWLQPQHLHTTISHRHVSCWATAEICVWESQFWEMDRNTNSRALPQTYQIKNSEGWDW